MRTRPNISCKSCPSPLNSPPNITPSRTYDDEDQGKAVREGFEPGKAPPESSDFAIDDEDGEQENSGDPNDQSHDAQIWSGHGRGKSPERVRTHYGNLDEGNVWDAGESSK